MTKTFRNRKSCVVCVLSSSAMCLLSNNVNDYHFVSQGKTAIPGVDDGEEMTITDVSDQCTVYTC